jgi:hypothetical protein
MVRGKTEEQVKVPWPCYGRHCHEGAWPELSIVERFSCSRLVKIPNDERMNSCF